MVALRQDMAWEYLEPEKILVSYHGPNASAEQWDTYLTLMDSLRSEEHLRFVVRVEGPPPSAAYRKRIAALVKWEWPVALISSSTAMRFVASTFTFVNRNIRFFTPNQVPEVMGHLQCTAVEAIAAEAALRRISRGEEQQLSRQR